MLKPPFCQHAHFGRFRQFPGLYAYLAGCGLAPRLLYRLVVKTVVRIGIIGFAGAVLAFKAMGVGRADLPSQNLSGVICGGSSAEYELTFSDRIVLNTHFFNPELSENDNLKPAIEEKIRYFTQYFLNSKKQKKLFQVVRSSVPAQISITSKKAVEYPFDLKVDWTPKPELPVDDSYTKAAIARGYTSKKDPAIEAEYSARITVLTCGTSNEALELEGPLPLDPMLFYWNIPKEKRRPLKWNKSRATTNFCADSEIADFPHPNYLWYFWDPYLVGRDEKGRSFDCNKNLKPGVDFVVQKAKLTRIQEPKENFDSLRDHLGKKESPISVTYFFGYLDHQVAEPHPKQVEDLIHFQFTNNFVLETAEWGTSTYLQFIDSVRKMIKTTTTNVKIDGDYTLTELSGTLPVSGRPVKLRLILGPTDIFSVTKTGHWKWIPDALENDDVVVYAGHSGLGENFNLSRAKDELKISDESLRSTVTKKPYQLLVYLSCYSYSYFGQDLLDLARPHTPARDIIYSAASLGFDRYKDTSISVLDFLDQTLSGQGLQIQKRMKPKSDFLVFKSFNSGSPR